MSRVRLLRRVALCESAFEVELERPAGFRFSPGQNVCIRVNGQPRDYSICSPPEAETLLILVRRIPGGAVSPLLCDSPPGTACDLTGPHGLFSLTVSDRPVVLAATGVGIAPFLGFVRAGARGFTLLHGVRTPDELFYRAELKAAAGTYAACLSRAEAPGCFSGRVTDWSRALLPSGPHDFYLCGSRRMVRDMTLLIDERFPGSRVYTEIFF